MCCCFFPFFNTRNQFLRLFFSTFGFQTWHIFTFSLPLFSPPFSFSPPLCSVSFLPLFLYYLSPFSLYPLFLSQCSCSLAWSWTLVWWTTWTFSSRPVCILVWSGLCCPHPQPLRAAHLWHTLWYHSSCPSSLFSCSHSFREEIHTITVEESLPSLWLSFWTLSLTYNRLCPWQMCLCYGWGKECCVVSEQTRQTCWTKGSGNPPPPTVSYCSALALLVISTRQERQRRVPVYSDEQ